ncbi:poly(A)-specific ribonuclease PARN-like, partial [Pollicipes pollicipes]|uniref:poly(A)-specific ribonuclease PARN-like n=1 Tax=Pollicipes pollicipes TaxID=41117 RepID=UPI0018853052
MDITKENFATHLPRIRDAISRCSFLAVDCEFSGLTTGGTTCQYDTPAERYAHLRRTAAGFLVIQFGLAAFTLDQERGRYTQETFNFYLFPRHPSQGSFLCQPSSLEFLSGNGFDFNKLIKDGVPYLKPAQVETLRDQLERQQEEAASPAAATTTAAAAATASVPDNQTEFLDKAVSQVGEFLRSSDEHLDFHGLSGYQRKIMYDHVSARVATPLDLETQRTPGGQRTLRVRRAAGPEERRRRLRERLDEAAGFCQVISAISESGKTVVGHNMLLDLLHMVEQFVCPLPQSYADFRAVVGCVFPSLVDTKVMGSTQPFRDLIPSTTLGEMVVCLGTHPFTAPTVVAAEGSSGPEYRVGDSKHHEAGYDAFLTAVCFASMVNYLGLLLTPPKPLLEPSADIVRPFSNKVFVMRMADMPYLNLTGDDVEPSRDHVFHLTFPAAWKTGDIVQLFSAFSRVHVAWINDTSAFVSLDRRDQASQVLQNVKAAGLFTLCTYSEWQAAQRMSRPDRATKQKT